MNDKDAPPSFGSRVWIRVQKLVAFLLWLVTVSFGVIEIYLLQQISLNIYVYFSSEQPAAIFISNIVVLLAAFLWIFFAIGSGEYHRKHAGEAKSWTLFAWTVAIELLILILYFVV